MFSLSCPACGGQVVFKSRASVYAVCSYCKSTLLRQDMELQKYGSVAEVQWDQPPLQVGTRGKYGMNPFEVIGRYRMAWAEGYWNEWYILFDDGRDGWLAEAQGFYAILFEDRRGNEPPPLDRLRVGRVLNFSDNKKSYEIDDIKKASCIGTEGELLSKMPLQYTYTSVDMTAEDGSFACLQYDDGRPSLFFGEYIEFDQFEFTGLRELDGWEYSKREATVR